MVVVVSRKHHCVLHSQNPFKVPSLLVLSTNQLLKIGPKSVMCFVMKLYVRVSIKLLAESRPSKLRIPLLWKFQSVLLTRYTPDTTHSRANSFN